MKCFITNIDSNHSPNHYLTPQIAKPEAGSKILISSKPTYDLNFNSHLKNGSIS
jgi:hypothetical protein